MKKQFIGYNEAVSLKELGFDEPCLATIDQIDFIHIKGTNSSPRGSMMYDAINCPTFSQAFRWFREKYGIKTYVYEVLEERFVFITYTNQLDYKMSATYHPTYEDTELECLKKLIEICRELK